MRSGVKRIGLWSAGLMLLAAAPTPVLGPTEALPREVPGPRGITVLEACARDLQPLRGIDDDLSENGVRDRRRFIDVIMNAACTRDEFIVFFEENGFQLRSITEREDRTSVQMFNRTERRWLDWLTGHGVHLFFIFSPGGELVDAYFTPTV